MFTIDTHTHIFPDDQAAAILENTSHMFKIPLFGKGTASDLIRRMDQNGIDYAVIHMVAMLPGGVENLNTWLINLNEHRFIKSGTLHPKDPNLYDEIKRLTDNGITTVKLHPDVQQFFPDDRDLVYPLYEALAKENMRAMFHVGGEPQPRPNDKSKPWMIKTVARDFPELTIIAAHMGGLNMWQEALDHLAGLPNIYMESSQSYAYISASMAARIIKKHGHDKIFFGSDYPFQSMNDSLSAAQAVPFLTDSQRRDILGNNARKFFLNNY